MKITYALLSVAFILSFVTACAPKLSPSQNGAPDTANFISEDKAIEIALGQAGLSAKEVRFDRTEFDYDDGIWHYEIEFRQGNTEYDADIKADDGSILSFSKDRID